MDIDFEKELASLRKSAEVRLTEVEAAIADLIPEAEALRKVIENVDTLVRIHSEDPVAKQGDRPAPPATRPRGRTAARLLLMEHEGQQMSVDQVVAGLLERGWATPSPRLGDTVRTNLLRAVKSFPDVHRVGRGMYKFVAVDPRDMVPNEVIEFDPF